MGSDAGGETKTKPPQWWTDAAKYAVGQGKKVAQIGYVPYEGPDIAAFNPQQISAMQGAADWFGTFNTPGQAPVNVASSLMPATDFGNGLMGYSSYPGYQQALANLAESQPGLYSYINSFFPHTNFPGDPASGGGLGDGPGGGLGGGGTDTPGSGNLGFGNNIVRMGNKTYRKNAKGKYTLISTGYTTGGQGGGQGGMGGGGLAARGGMQRGPTNINPGGGGWFGQNNSSAGGGFNHGFAS